MFERELVKFIIAKARMDALLFLETYIKTKIGMLGDWFAQTTNTNPREIAAVQVILAFLEKKARIAVAERY